jgi:glycosyltransferase involved in cell wall biosynthesis
VKLLVVDVEHRVPDVPPPSVGEQWVLVRLHGAPLGILHVGTAGCAATDLARRISREFAERILRHLAGDAVGAPDPERLEPLPVECPRFAGLQLPVITVAVCTRNGAERLPSCLRALDALRYPASRIERIVVDNAPFDARVAELVASHPGMRYVAEPRPGLDWARNRAILEARGEIVAFTDDDVSVDDGWAEAIGRSFASDPVIDAITGLVVPDEIDYGAQRLFEDYGGFNRGYDRQYFKGEPGARIARRFAGAGLFGTGANMAFRRSIFERIGLFDPALDVGTPTNGGGDLEMFFRLLKEGGTLLYDPAAIVRHRHRTSYEALKVQLTNNGLGFYSYLVRSAGAYPDERGTLLRFGAWWMWWWNLRRLLRSFVRPAEFPRDLILAEMRGSLAGLTRYRRASAQASQIAERFGPQRPSSLVEDLPS